MPTLQPLKSTLWKNPKLNVAFFKRSHERDREAKDIFMSTSNGVSALSKLLFQIILAPVVAATSILSSSLFLMVANVFMGLGFTFEYIYSSIRGEVSTVDKILTTSIIGIAILFSLTFSPIGFWVFSTVFTIWAAASQLATAVSGAFIARKIIVPPLKRFCERCCSRFGTDIQEMYWQKRPLDKALDEAIVEHLLNGPATSENQWLLDTYNRLLKMFCRYNSKYHETIFGNLILEKKITTIKEHTDYLILKGRVEGLPFIREKISYKCTKIRKLKESLDALNKSIEENIEKKPMRAQGFFFEDSQHYERAKMLLKKEMWRQDQKAIALIDCLPDLKQRGDYVQRLKKALHWDGKEYTCDWLPTPFPNPDLSIGTQTEFMIKTSHGEF